MTALDAYLIGIALPVVLHVVVEAISPRRLRHEGLGEVDVSRFAEGAGRLRVRFLPIHDRVDEDRSAGEGLRAAA